MASKLKIMLLDKVARVGSKHDVIDVKRGYAMNFLIPKGLAKMATKEEIAAMEAKQQVLAEKLEKIRDEAFALKEKIGANAEVTIEGKTTEKGGLYGSVTAEQIAEAMNKAHKLELTSENVQLAKPIKEIGDAKVVVQLAEGVKLDVMVHVTAA